MLQAWLLAAMLTWQPPRSMAEQSRYESIVDDVVAVVENEAALFVESDEREKTALLLLSIASYESGGFAKDVDDGTRTGDGGSAHCLMQVHLREGEAITDRRSCLRLGLSRARESMDLCKRLPQEDRLGGYTHGRCVPNNRPARVRWGRAVAWWRAHPYEA